MLVLPRVCVLVARMTRFMRTLGRKTVPGIFHRQGSGRCRDTGQRISHEVLKDAHEMRQAWRPNGVVPRMQRSVLHDALLIRGPSVPALRCIVKKDRKSVV